ncbi:L-seryl-tRNA(Sec) selenium transferase [Vagococcus vulneris]|uniref:L-seryl-tRNA(Sec) selenium transferase n=1 Tax=Vagococcus vulneris TaxID=1977869 RepID=A0A429ZXG9_9ENTE|nr:L-seryl-tRNA(Sec) selenium transferase [Vagococcus vulneris]RST98591.1 L-seryl-tRNA(Sec) selenium transferase [Vagococcus vulneris]
MVNRQLLSQLPSVNELLNQSGQLIENYTLSVTKDVIQKCLKEIRIEILDGTRNVLPTADEFYQRITEKLQQQAAYSLKVVVNGTGTIVHTNLGRSLLSPKLKTQLLETACSYTNLEYDLSEGRRGSRYQHLEGIIKQLTGAEDVLVVNNNAAAVLLVLGTLVPEKEVVVSRGELVEIGGSFRIPEVIKMGGGSVSEVGTTNKTHLSDYATAITENTGALMKVHTSNYRIVGFTEAPSIEELSELAHQHGLPLINDLGSGLFYDLQQFGLPYEPTIKEALDQGCDVVTFSGDKLLGGPQAGIIVGKKKYIEPMKKNQLLRALRVDKMTLSMLEATLHCYADSDLAFREVPTLQMIGLSAVECQHRAEQLFEKIQSLNLPLQAEILAEKSNIGGGSFPEYYLDTFVVALYSDRFSAAELEEALRLAETPIIVRVKNNQILIDVRTLLSGDDDTLCKELSTVFQ